MEPLLEDVHEICLALFGKNKVSILRCQSKEFNQREQAHVSMSFFYMPALEDSSGGRVAGGEQGGGGGGGGEGYGKASHFRIP